MGSSMFILKWYLLKMQPSVYVVGFCKSSRIHIVMVIVKIYFIPEL